MGRKGCKMSKKPNDWKGVWKMGRKDWKMDRQPQDWQEGLEAGREKLKDGQAAPRLAGVAGSWAGKVGRWAGSPKTGRPQEGLKDRHERLEVEEESS
jgi:hypothetical protein